VEVNPPVAPPPRISARDRLLRRAVKADDRRLTPELLASLAADRMQHVYVLLDASGGPCALATMLLEPKLLRGGTTVAHVCEMSAIPTLASSSFASPEFLLQLVEEARREGCYKVITDVKPASVDAFLKLGFRQAQMAVEKELVPAPQRLPHLAAAALAGTVAAGSLMLAGVYLGLPARVHSAAIACSWLAFAASAANAARLRANRLLEATSVPHRIRVGSPGGQAGTEEDTTTLTVRRLCASDSHAAYLELLAQLSVAPSMTSERFAEQLERVEGSGAHVILVAEPADGGPLVACGTIVIERRVLERGQLLVAHIEDIVVDKSLRGCGLGRALIQHLLAVAAEAGCARATLNCTPENAAFYQRCGMRLSDAAGLALYF